MRASLKRKRKGRQNNSLEANFNTIKNVEAEKLPDNRRVETDRTIQLNDDIMNQEDELPYSPSIEMSK